MAWYNWTNVFLSTKCLILHRTPTPLDIFFEICWICSFQLRWQSMRMPRYLTPFCWLIGLPSISMFKEELFIFFWWGWNITKCVLAILREFIGTKTRNYCLKSVCHFEVTRFYVILLCKQHNWTLGAYSVRIITHKSQRSNSKFVKDQWNVSHDSRTHACMFIVGKLIW